MSDPLDKPPRPQPDPEAANGSPPTTPDSRSPLPSTPFTEAPPFRPPTHPGDLGRLGRYRIVKPLGKGGMGMVYLGYDPTMRRKVAIKVLPARLAHHPGARQRFFREARTAAAVRSDHIVAIIDVDEDNGIPFIAMEYLQGTSLDRYLATQPPLTVPQILRIGLEVSRGLAAAHEHGLVHRDIKPANLWLEASQGRVKILDFGLVKETNSEDGSLTQTGQVVGTPAFMSPEQARGEPVTAATDLFSLGVVLYRLATGRLPFQGATTMAVLMALGLDEPPPVRELNPAIPEALAAIIHRLLAKSVADRFASAAAVHDALAVVAGKPVRLEKPLSAVPLTPPTEAPQASAPPSGPITAPITVAIQPESVWDQLDVADPSPDGQSSGVGPRKSLTGTSLWSILGLVLIVGLSVAVLLVVLDTTQPKRGTGPNQDTAVPVTRVFFNGKNFLGWVARDGYWRVENEQILGRFPADVKPLTTCLYGRYLYKDFELSFQVRLPTGGTSALLFRAEPNPGLPFTLIGPACSISRTDCGGLALKPGHRSAGLPADEVARLFKPTEFNQLAVRCVGQHVTIRLNGQITVDGDYDLPAQGVIGWELNEQSAAHEVQIKDVVFSDLTRSPVPH
jgi:serine/threonine protein kinase